MIKRCTVSVHNGIDPEEKSTCKDCINFFSNKNRQNPSEELSLQDAFTFGTPKRTKKYFENDLENDICGTETVRNHDFKRIKRKLEDMAALEQDFDSKTNDFRDKKDTEVFSATKRIRGTISNKKFTSKKNCAKKILLGLVYKRKDVLESCSFKKVNMEEKRKAWTSLAIEYNSIVRDDFKTIQELKLMYANIKKIAKEKFEKFRKAVLEISNTMSELLKSYSPEEKMIFLLMSNSFDLIEQKSDTKDEHLERRVFEQDDEERKKSDLEKAEEEHLVFEPKGAFEKNTEKDYKTNFEFKKSSSTVGKNEGNMESPEAILKLDHEEYGKENSEKALKVVDEGVLEHSEKEGNLESNIAVNLGKNLLDKFGGIILPEPYQIYSKKYRPKYFRKADEGKAMIENIEDKADKIRENLTGCDESSEDTEKNLPEHEEVSGVQKKGNFKVNFEKYLEKDVNGTSEKEQNSATELRKYSAEIVNEDHSRSVKQNAKHLKIILQKVQLPEENLRQAKDSNNEVNSTKKKLQKRGIPKRKRNFTKCHEKKNLAYLIKNLGDGNDDRNVSGNDDEENSKNGEKNFKYKIKKKCERIDETCYKKFYFRKKQGEPEKKVTNRFDQKLRPIATTSAGKKRKSEKEVIATDVPDTDNNVFEVLADVPDSNFKETCMNLPIKISEPRESKLKNFSIDEKERSLENFRENIQSGEKSVEEHHSEQQYDEGCFQKEINGNTNRFLNRNEISKSSPTKSAESEKYTQKYHERLMEVCDKYNKETSFDREEERIEYVMDMGTSESEGIESNFQSEELWRIMHEYGGISPSLSDEYPERESKEDEESKERNLEKANEKHLVPGNNIIIHIWRDPVSRQSLMKNNMGQILNFDTAASNYRPWQQQLSEIKERFDKNIEIDDEVNLYQEENFWNELEEDSSTSEKNKENLECLDENHGEYMEENFDEALGNSDEELPQREVKISEEGQNSGKDPKDKFGGINSVELDGGNAIIEIGPKTCESLENGSRRGTYEESSNEEEGIIREDEELFGKAKEENFVNNSEGYSGKEAKVVSEEEKNLEMALQEYLGKLKEECIKNNTEIEKQPENNALGLSRENLGKATEADFKNDKENLEKRLILEEGQLKECHDPEKNKKSLEHLEKNLKYKLEKEFGLNVSELYKMYKLKKSCSGINQKSLEEKRTNTTDEKPRSVPSTIVGKEEKKSENEIILERILETETSDFDESPNVSRSDISRREGNFPTIPKNGKREQKQFGNDEKNPRNFLQNIRRHFSQNYVQNRNRYKKFVHQRNDFSKIQQPYHKRFFQKEKATGDKNHHKSFRSIRNNSEQFERYARKYNERFMKDDRDQIRRNKERNSDEKNLDREERSRRVRENLDYSETSFEEEDFKAFNEGDAGKNPDKKGKEEDNLEKNLEEMLKEIYGRNLKKKLYRINLRKCYPKKVSFVDDKGQLSVKFSEKNSKGNAFTRKRYNDRPQSFLDRRKSYDNINYAKKSFIEREQRYSSSDRSAQQRKVSSKDKPIISTSVDEKGEKFKNEMTMLISENEGTKSDYSPKLCMGELGRIKKDYGELSPSPAENKPTAYFGSANSRTCPYQTSQTGYYATRKSCTAHRTEKSNSYKLATTNSTQTAYADTLRAGATNSIHQTQTSNQVPGSSFSSTSVHSTDFRPTILTNNATPMMTTIKLCQAPDIERLGGKPSQKPQPFIYCHVCKICCRGLQNYHQHLQGQEHLKRKAAAQETEGE